MTTINNQYSLRMLFHRRSVKLRIAVVGYGKLGRVLVRSLIKARYRITSIIDSLEVSDKWLNSREIICSNRVEDIAADTDFVFICVNDDLISEISGKISNEVTFIKPITIAHTAGSMPSTVIPLASNSDSNVFRLTWHPTQTFTGDEEPNHFKKICVTMDGDASAVAKGSEIARRLGAFAVEISPDSRDLYHLGCVFASNFLPVLFGNSMEMLIKTGMTKKEAYHCLDPLIRSTMKSIKRKGISEAITGPLARDDQKTISRHKLAISDSPQTIELYETLNTELLRLIKSGSKS